jgi:hypothetical protein
MLTITDHEVEWDPKSPTFQEQEDAFEANDLLPFTDKKKRTIYSMHTGSYLPESLDQTDMSAKLHHSLKTMTIMATSTMNNRLKFNAEELSKRWAIGKQTATDTVKATTQSFIHTAIHPIERRYRTKNATLWYNHLNLPFILTQCSLMSSLSLVTQCAKYSAMTKDSPSWYQWIENQMLDMLFRKLSGILESQNIYTLMTLKS